MPILLRRESENDVQLLELPHESIHPKDWTLRNTAVKRFKRSAADFKLDIPGLVRPPPVLERVCGEFFFKKRERQPFSFYIYCFNFLEWVYSCTSSSSSRVILY